MAFNINDLLVNKVPMTLGNKQLTAEYTNDADQQYQDFMLQLGDTQNQAKNEDIENMPIDVQQDFLAHVHEQVMELGQQYIASLFNDEDTAIIMEAINGREENLINTTAYFHQMGDATSDEYKATMEKPNREAKRMSDHKKGKNK